MSSENILSTPILDLIFENRNKEYGAYTLRKYYPERLYFALGGMVVLVSVFCSFFFWKGDKKNDSSVSGILVDIDSVVLITPPPVEPPPPMESKKIAVIQNTVPVISSEVVETDVPEQKEMENKLIGTVTTEGDPALEDVPAPPVAEPVKAAPAPAPEPEAKEEVLTTADVMPEYPGGIESLKRFLSRNLRNPDEDMTSASSIRVVARFVVDKDGSISQIIFKETGGIKFEQEVNRVLKKMPKWKPGVFKGRATAVYFTLPVVFQVTDQ